MYFHFTRRVFLFVLDWILMADQQACCILTEVGDISIDLRIQGGMMMEWITNEAMYPEVFIKITLALVLSIAIGVERAVKEKPIG